jgi:hypothetical protein
MSSEQNSVFSSLKSILASRQTSVEDRLKAFCEIAKLYNLGDRVSKLCDDVATEGMTPEERRAVELAFLKVICIVETYALLVPRYGEEDAHFDDLVQHGDYERLYNSFAECGRGCSSIGDCTKDMCFRAKGLAKVFPTPLMATVVKLANDLHNYGLPNEWSNLMLLQS